MKRGPAARHAGSDWPPIEGTPVVFRRWPSGKVFVLLPTVPADAYGVLAATLDHGLRRGAASPLDVFLMTDAPPEAAYKALAEMLTLTLPELGPYTAFDVLWAPMHEMRHDAALEVRRGKKAPFLPTDPVAAVAMMLKDGP